MNITDFINNKTDFELKELLLLYKHIFFIKLREAFY